VICARAEELARDPRARRYDVIVARAVAPLAELARLALPLLQPGGSLVAWKREGEGWSEELATAASLVGADSLRVEPVSAPALIGALLVVVTPRHRASRAEAKI
jgi:16S rRNA G527 N7-methylase RsmG